MYLKRVERSWSGNLAPNLKPNKTNFRKMRTRIHNRGPGSEAVFDSAPATPRLVRCSGMRRDWSFEDLRRALEG
ncbi:hypothetical protein PHJA_000866300 [Phtheirospermum japonicum]|uniref:Uncharacterized protein n=1 Tax=Phtheirospermum japonicum TaxID=374723 RepID=A0A830BK50_9LAMI|nr:hypothetical protein PHJA_000866300 [Phtheirospermum japonicum]